MEGKGGGEEEGKRISLLQAKRKMGGLIVLSVSADKAFKQKKSIY